MTTPILCLKKQQMQGSNTLPRVLGNCCGLTSGTLKFSKQKLHRVLRENAFCTKSWNSWSQKNAMKQAMPQYRIYFICCIHLHSNFLATCAAWRYMMVHALHAMSTRPLEWSHHLCSCPSLRRKLKRSLQWPVLCRFSRCKFIVKLTVNKHHCTMYYILQWDNCLNYTFTSLACIHSLRIWALQIWVVCPSKRPALVQ